ncbi:hypothetical protein LOK49_LG08G01782 [Camellia lanceoleosa]|uniref:Uncharacterized protein n=1 Tax=Camellia lanceoleosa TaxID=1840588 RepID=A0ACC0GSB1_9ERIC|nr:hypothetical protein LOK49_LG08G01782 [Camellia lanceoleosa]
MPKQLIAYNFQLKLISSLFSKHIQPSSQNKLISSFHKAISYKHKLNQTYQNSLN